jgi:transcriptional regulator with XRE-family HTH domain
MVLYSAAQKAHLCDLCNLCAEKGTAVTHIGQELRVRFEASGMTLKAFAARLGRTPKGMYALFDRGDIDTEVLRRACEVLKFNFFRLLAADVERSQAQPGDLREPGAAYGRSEQAPTIIVIQGDAGASDLVERITQAVKR